MSMDNILGIAATALNAQMVRLNSIASNMANGSTVGSSPQTAEPARVLPFGATRVEVEVRDEQCGNPHCVVKSRNGRHAGPHVFPEPPPRR